MRYSFATLALSATLSIASTADAVTVGFDGLANNTPTPLTIGDYQLSGPDARIVNGNCDVKPCLAQNPNEVTRLERTDTNPFTLTSFWFQLLGIKAALTVTSSAGGSVTMEEPTYTHNTGYVFALGALPLFQNVAWISFDNTGQDVILTVAKAKPNGGGPNGSGNIRIDDLVLDYTAPAVPLPAAGWLLLAGLGGLAAAKRRKSA
jgi:hypothetical protein